jgi:CHAT domain-containing protein/predicted negative regulator of RcsB-dependent stress response
MKKKRRAVARTIGPLALMLITAITTGAQNPPDVRPLSVGVSVGRQIKGGEVHYYTIELKQGQVLRVELQGKGISLGVALVKVPDKMALGPYVGDGRARLTAVIEEAGRYEVAVDAPSGSLSGGYQLNAKIQEKVAPSDTEEIRAERLLAEGFVSQGEGLVRDSRTAIAKWEEAMGLWKRLGEKYWQGYVAGLIGRVHESLGDEQKALEFYNQALTLGRMVDDKSREATILNYIGAVYSERGDKQKALDYYNQALLLLRQVDDKAIEAETLNNVGTVYSDLADMQKALEFFNQALPLLRLVGDKLSEAATLQNIGKVYSDRGEKQRALGYYNQALSLRRMLNDKRKEAVTLTNIGATYNALGDSQKALESLNQALVIVKQVGDKRGEADTLNDIGAVYGDSSDPDNALTSYNQALPLYKLVGDLDGEGVTLSNLMEVWNEIGNRRLAIFYGKQSVNIYQHIRANIQNFDKGTQKGFVAFNQSVYRDLAEVLISEHRLEEAAQILDLLKLQEFADFVNGSGSPNAPTADATFSPSEIEIRNQYDQLFSRLFSLNTEYDDPSGKKGPELEQRLKALKQEIDQAGQTFRQFMAQLPDYFNQPLPAREANFEVNGIKPIVRDLGSGSVALYTLLAAQKYYVILLSPQLDQARQYYVRRAQLEKKVKQFKEVLQNPRVDPRPTAQELYQILVAPIAKDLQQSDARTLMWSLDGALRYVPMSALYDGQQYLVEKYQNVVIDPTSQGRLREQPEPTTWRGLGLGASKAFVGFKALSNVPDELDGIIRQEGVKDDRGVLPGEKLLDDSFTEAKMYEALKRNYKVVHIASHFVLSSKDARESYLLLGDGGKLKLSQISDGAKIFDQVDLVALSACDTGSGGADADGREVDAFGIITQQKGAKAVLASLWAVDDRSTKDVMVGFYQQIMGGGGMTKSEALRQAQLMLLRGEKEVASVQDSQRGDDDRRKQPANIKEIAEDNRREGVDETKKTVDVRKMQWEEEPAQGREFKVNPKAPYSHPYYWAPFILIGNWR